ncbi:hypothetical protein MAIT1_01045 [Magnetofaba australis IT-1]|uniref:Uncharacterized protein n=1 Tax=Magnetofaba australis IT-1 TaxID=1434232 RepID=A0A1Y2K4M6_9PROT|nr:hypothetical protein MAIT1_01045 [Magnetofaba australis IT-1]
MSLSGPRSVSRARRQQRPQQAAMAQESWDLVRQELGHATRELESLDAQMRQNGRRGRGVQGVNAPHRAEVAALIRAMRELSGMLS